MVGIYKIENKINHKIYIGQSQNIEARWRQHIWGAGKYTTIISQALGKYGIENFSFEVVEECPIEQLDEREQFWIDHYNSLKPNGYNMVDVDNVLHGEDNPNSKFSTAFVREIRERVFLNKEEAKEVFEEYKDVVGRGYFYHLLHGDFRLEEGSGIELVESLVDKAGSKNGRHKIDEEEVLKIRNLIYVDKIPTNEVYCNYKDIISFDAFQKAATGESWKNVDTSMIVKRTPERKNKPKAKLTEEDVRQIRYRAEVLKHSVSEIFMDYCDRTTRTTIQRVVNYETWKNVKPVSTISEA